VSRAPDFPLMGNRWVNAAIEIKIPLDVSLNASSQGKLDASVEALEGSMPDGATGTCRWEIVEEQPLRLQPPWSRRP